MCVCELPSSRWREGRWRARALQEVILHIHWSASVSAVARIIVSGSDSEQSHESVADELGGGMM